MSRKISIAPMLDWTDRHYRYMMRLITRKTLLYTEMIVDETLIHQKDSLDFFLGHDPIESPIAIQLGGSKIESIGLATNIIVNYNNYHHHSFTEINLNVGCPSQRVAKNNFGASLMLDPLHVYNLTQEMIKNSKNNLNLYIPITVKCRIGVDDFDSYEHLYHFIETVSGLNSKNAIDRNVTHFIIHARKCLLNGLTPHENRTIPLLKYDYVYRLCKDFPMLTFTLNGGINNTYMGYQILNDKKDILPNLHSIMIGRAAYNNPWDFRDVDAKYYNVSNIGLSRREIIFKYLDYAENLQQEWGYSKDTIHLESNHINNNNHNNKGMFFMPNSMFIKPILSLFSSEKGGKAFKRHISENIAKKSKNRNNNNTFNSGLRDIIESALEYSISSDILDKTVFDEKDRCNV